MPKLPLFDAKSLVKIEERPRPGHVWFACDPGIIYPAVIARIREVLKSGEFPNELVDLNTPPEADPRGVARTYLTIARTIQPEAFKWALQEHDRFYSNYTDIEIVRRAQALELARLWFTQALHVQAGGDGTPIGVHWINVPAFKS
jgi:hypothetical protein